MKFSVIVPVYNAEKYLKKCIESVLAQTYSDWEMILINDGSTDRSLDIIQSYVQTDSRIKAITQENGGPGKARNTGLDHAVGDYVIFLDSDDYIDSDYFRLLQPKAENADVVFIDILQVTPNGAMITKEFLSVYKGKKKDIFQRAMLTGKAPWGGCRKAVSLDLLKTHNIKFSALNIGEEALFSYRIFESARSIDFLDEKPVYMYVNHEGSQSKLMTDDPWGPTVGVLKAYLQENPERYVKYANTLNAFNVAATIVSIDRMTRMYRGAERRQKISARMKEFRMIYAPEFGIDTDSLVMKARVLLPFVKAGVTFPVVLCSKLRSFMKMI